MTRAWPADRSDCPKVKLSRKLTAAVAIAILTRIKGIGRWSAEIYLLFAEGRADVFPAGDLAVMVELGRLMGLEDKPSEKQLREIAEAWRPYRGAAAVLAWHSYNSSVL